MTVTLLYRPSAIAIDSTVIGDIESQDLALEHELGGEALSGELYRRFQALYHQGHTPGFSTRDVAAVLGQCGASGLSLATKSLILYLLLQSDGGTVAAGSVHRSLTFAKGILVPRTLTCEHGKDASITYGAIVTSSDGSTSPMTLSDVAAAPTITASVRHTLGGITIGSVALSHCRRLEIEFGLEVVSEGADSDILDTMATLRAVMTEIRLTGIDTTWLSAAKVPETGLAGTHANTTIYLRKRAAGGSFVANGTAEHIKFTADGLCVPTQVVGGDPNEVGLRMPVEYDGSNAPLIIDTASAIT